MKWACPKCGATAGKHGKKPCRKGPCGGLVCECDEDATGEFHGESQTDPCANAVCNCCGWGGRLPPRLRNMKPWEKTALAAGWAPPAGWEEALKDGGRVAGEERSAT